MKQLLPTVQYQSTANQKEEKNARNYALNAGIRRILTGLPGNARMNNRVITK